MQIATGQIHKFITGEIVDADTAPQGGALNPILTTIVTAHNDTDTKLGQLSSTLSGGVVNGSVNTKLGEVFAASAGQTVFTLTKGTYVTGNHMLDVYVNGVRKSVDNGDFTETSGTQFTLTTALQANDKVEIEYWQGVTVTPAMPQAHESTHIKGGSDPIDMMQLTNYDNFFILHMMGAI